MIAHNNSQLVIEFIYYNCPDVARRPYCEKTIIIIIIIIIIMVKRVRVRVTKEKV
jgi:hypothetical protein